MTSTMPSVYLHYFGTESSNSILQAYGIINDDNKKQANGLLPKQCPNCNEPNKPESKFCGKCSMVLTYDAYNETVTSERDKENKLTILENQFNCMQSQIQLLISALHHADEPSKNAIGRQLIQNGYKECSQH